MDKRIQSLNGVTMSQIKTIADLLFGDKVIKIKLNSRDLIYEIYVLEQINIPSEMQQRFSEKLKQCEIITLVKAEPVISKKK